MSVSTRNVFGFFLFDLCFVCGKKQSYNLVERDIFWHFP